MKTIRCNLKKQVGFSQLSQNHYVRIWGYFLKNFKKFHLFIEESTLVYITDIMFEALSLLVCLRNPHSKGYSSISILYFS